MLKPGGVVITQTHQTWPVHDRPWDFFRFSKDSWRGLFNEAHRLPDHRRRGVRAVLLDAGGPAAKQRVDTHRASARYMISICLAEKTGEPRVGWKIDRPLYERIAGAAGYPG